MNERYKLKGLKESFLLKKIKRKNLERAALRGATKPIDLAGIQALQSNGVLDIETFQDNIGSIFPFMLNQISEGETLKGLERLFGMKPRVLVSFMERYPRLGNEIKKARRIRTDRDHDLIDIFS